MEESLTICRCQIDKYNYFDIGNIDYVSKNVVSLWQKIICRGSQPTEVDIDMDMDYNHHKSNSSSHPDYLTQILEPITGKIKLSKEHLTKIKSSHLSNNPQTIILCDIIQDRLPLNHLQRIVIEKVLTQAIFNKENQCYHRSHQLLLYIKRKRRVGKSKIVKAIHLRFSFLTRQKELLIATLTRATAANIGVATIHGALNINDHIQKQYHLAKSPWQNRLALTLDEISIVSLKLLATVDMYLNQAKGKTNNNTVVLSNLALVIVMRNFYKFLLVIGRSL